MDVCIDVRDFHKDFQHPEGAMIRPEKPNATDDNLVQRDGNRKIKQLNFMQLHLKVALNTCVGSHFTKNARASRFPFQNVGHIQNGEYVKNSMHYDVFTILSYLILSYSKAN